MVFATNCAWAMPNPVVSCCARASRSVGDSDRRQFHCDARTGLPRYGERCHGRIDASVTTTIRLQSFARHDGTRRFDVVPRGQPLRRASRDVRHGAPHRSTWARRGLDATFETTFRAVERPDSRVGFLAPLYSALLIGSHPISDRYTSLEGA